MIKLEEFTIRVVIAGLDAVVLEQDIRCPSYDDAKLQAHFLVYSMNQSPVYAEMPAFDYEVIPTNRMFEYEES